MEQGIEKILREAGHQYGKKTKAKLSPINIDSQSKGHSKAISFNSLKTREESVFDVRSINWLLLNRIGA